MRRPDQHGGEKDLKQHGNEHRERDEQSGYLPLYGRANMPALLMFEFSTGVGGYERSSRLAARSPAR